MWKDEEERKRGVLVKDAQELLLVKWRRELMVGESGSEGKGSEM